MTRGRFTSGGLGHLPTEDLELIFKASNMQLVAKQARDDFMTYCRFMRPHPEHPDDANYSAYQITPLNRTLGDLLHRIEQGKLHRAAVSAPPQHGKSETISRLFPAWYMGRNPRKHLFVASYNQDMANSFGSDVRTILRSQRHRLVFPEFEIAKGSASKDFIQTTEGGKASFVGVGGSGSGKPADLMIVDDSIKGDEDSLTPGALEKLWQWFVKVALARLRSRSSIIILNTRWSTDDLIGRLTDPDHPDYDETLARLWTTLNIPAVVDDPVLADALGVELKRQTDPLIIEQFGDKPLAALWEEEHDLLSLAIKRRTDKRSFDALYLGKPSPDEGDYYKAEWLIEYGPEDLPSDLRFYGASDHAVSTRRNRDFTVIGCVGIDRDDNIWVLPDLVWERMETDRTVEEMIAKMRTYRPMLWWMESELISKSFGPFLRKRMQEERVYVVLDPQTPSSDKKLRGRAIQGRLAMGKVRFPKHAHWWPDARHQLLKFPHGSHDDFCDWLAWIGLGLTKELAPSRPSAVEKSGPRYGTIEWVKWRSRMRERSEMLRRASGGF